MIHIHSILLFTAIISSSAYICIASPDIYLKIANGKPAQDNQFPFTASVALWDIHTCGASLIDSRVVLTAAHCVWDQDFKTLRDPTAVSVTIGNPSLTYGQKFNVERIVVPSQFDSSRSYFGDIAILLLNSPVQTTQQTVKLQSKYKESKIYTALGWGYTANSTNLSPVLQYTFVNGLSKSKCVAALTRFDLGALPEDHFCAGLNPNHADTCKGDSGGPLLVSGSTIQSGITSYGPESSSCGGRDNLGVYTSVAYWYPWIQDTLSLYNMRGVVAPSRLNTPMFDTCSTSSGGVPSPSQKKRDSSNGDSNSNIAVVEIRTTKKSNNSSNSSNNRVLKTSTSGKCCDACRVKKACVAWTWIKSSGVCQLLTTNAYTFYPSASCHSGTMTG